MHDQISKYLNTTRLERDYSDSSRDITISQYSEQTIQQDFTPPYYNCITEKRLMGGNPEKPQAQHHQQCRALLKKVKGWQRIFLTQLLSQSNINIYQAEKLALIAKQLEEVQENRLCRYCFSQAIWQSPEYYVCPKCGECLNIEFSALEIAGGEIDA